MQTMAFFFFIVSSLLVASLYIVSGRSKNALQPTDWPIVGVLPGLIPYLHNCMTASQPAYMASVASRRFFVTCDPENIRHIFTSNHANYLKGEEFTEVFDVTKGSLLNVDGESWRQQRARTQGIFSSPRLLVFMAACCRDKVEKGLTPFLTRAAMTRAPFDMQDLLTRFAFDVTATPIFCVDPVLLSSDDVMPPFHVADAMDTVMEVAYFRHLAPAWCWKAMRCLDIGPERKLAAAHAVLRRFVTEMTETRSTTRRTGSGDDQEDILASYIDDPEYNTNNELLRVTLIFFMIAGRDTVGAVLLWFFYNLAKNPRVVSSIRNELSPIASRKGKEAANAGGGGDMITFEPEETKALVYLHAALYESLRLFPPIPIERKTVVASDVMPSGGGGHEVRAGDTVLVSLYSLGRMEDVWEQDCREYRPERWLSEFDGGGKRRLRYSPFVTHMSAGYLLLAYRKASCFLGLLGWGVNRYVPSHKFLAFNSRPRICLGKDIAIMQIKTVIATIFWNFDVEVIEGQTVEPKSSSILQMKNGLKVKVKKRKMHAS